MKPPMLLVAFAALGSVLACGGETANTPPIAPPPEPVTAPPTPPAPTAVAPPPDAGPPAPPPPPQLTAKAFPLPGATAPVGYDYLVADRPHGKVWVPIGDTGSADVFDAAASTFTRVDGFKTMERDVRGQKRLMGPSAVTIGDGVAYVGNRATSEVCAVDLKSLKLGKCLKLPVPTDGVAYVASTKEVWVTTPRDHSLTVLDASKPDTLKAKLVVKTDGEPEGYAVDETRGLFFTNLEDKDKTLTIDLKTHAVKSTWSAGCGDAGPRGIALDTARNLVFVACTDKVEVLDGAHDGAVMSKADTGAGVDNLDYIDATKLLYVAAGKAAKLTIFRVEDKGQLTVVATAATAEGARNAVADGSGNAYVVDGRAARLLVVPAPPSP
jgi:DNA-binding beta-propeller fold protein YncE